MVSRMTSKEGLLSIFFISQYEASKVGVFSHPESCRLCPGHHTTTYLVPSTAVALGPEHASESPAPGFKAQCAGPHPQGFGFRTSGVGI